MRVVTRLALILTVAAAAACTSDQPAARQPAEKTVIQMPGALDLPFSSAVRAGDILYLSGQVGTVPEGGLIAGGVGPETRQTLENIRRVLEYAGSSVDRVVKCTVFLLDIGDYAAMNEVYAGFFGSAPPARSTVAGSGLALGAKVEIECLALAGE